jgi:hypothetical protein
MPPGMVFQCVHLKMKKLLPFFLFSLLLLNSCTVIGGIFKAGVWVGVLLVVFIIGIIIWLVTRRGGNSG